MVSAKEPSQSASSAVGPGGTTSATGLPKRVTRMGFLVLRTRSSSAKHLALNSEIATSSMRFPPELENHTIVNQSSQLERDFSNPSFSGGVGVGPSTDGCLPITG